MNNVQLEQYVLQGDEYILAEVYVGDASVRSDKLPCVSFTMQDVMDSIPHFPN